jgi:hypothetical protein
MLLIMMTGAAFAGTITVKLHAKHNYWTQLGSWRNPATIYVYGPSGYYRSMYVGGWWSLASTDNVVQKSFTGAPSGNYRVRVDWRAGNRNPPGNNAAAKQANQYFYTWWLFPNKTVDFTSN